MSLLINVSQASKEQQVFAAEDGKVRNERTRESTRGTSRAALAACGAKRKRKEAGGSDHEDTDGDYCPEEPNYADGAAARTEETGSDQHTRNTEKAARVRRHDSKRHRRAATHTSDQSSGASFPYFKEGFMTQPFSVSAFEAESKVAFAKLEDFLAEAAILQDISINWQYWHVKVFL
ncbi:hypothetical protein WJX79_005939 [Trebouxia sp. C0005]